MNELNVKFAIALEGYRTQDLKSDTSYVKWIFRLNGKKDGVGYQKLLPHRICTQDDYDLFYPVETGSANLLE